MSSRVSRTRLVRHFVSFIDQPRRAAGFALMAGLLLAGSSYGQTSRLRKEAATAAAAAASTNSDSTPSAQQVQPAPNSQLLATVTEETLPEPPVISWDGKELTIDAENATLSSILLGIRSRTGASIEMPSSTNSDRVAVHLGPAPMREVLSSLLYGTDFNYVIQSSNDDENTLDKVIISAKDSDPTEDTSSTATAASERHIRLMPGYGAPGKRDFEVEHQKAVENGQQDDSSTAGLTITQDPPSAPDTSADNTRAAATPDSSSEPPAADSAAGTAPAPDFGIQVAAQTQPAASGSSTSPTGGGGPLNKMEQDLQHMYQQRQQMQAQQNHSQGQAATN